MHTVEIDGYAIPHNGDYSGDAIIQPPKGKEITIPCAVLFEFVGQAVIDRRVSELEQQTGIEALGLVDDNQLPRPRNVKSY